MTHILGSGCPFWLDLTPEQRSILTDRARKHKALLHNQPNDNTVCVGGMLTDTRIDESEIILDQLLRRYSCIRPDEQIEEIAAIDEDADKTGPAAHLCITTNLQTIELPYKE